MRYLIAQDRDKFGVTREKERREILNWCDQQSLRCVSGGGYEI